MKNVYLLIIGFLIGFAMCYQQGCGGHKCPEMVVVPQKPISTPHRVISQPDIPHASAVPRTVEPLTQSKRQYKIDKSQGIVQTPSDSGRSLYQKEYDCQYPLETDSLYSFFSDDSLINCEVVVNGRMTQKPKIIDNHPVITCPSCPTIAPSKEKKWNIAVGAFLGGYKVPTAGLGADIILHKTVVGAGYDFLNGNYQVSYKVKLR